MKKAIILFMLLVIFPTTFLTFADINEIRSEGKADNNTVVDEHLENSTIDEPLEIKATGEPLEISAMVGEHQAISAMKELPENNSKEELYWVKVGAIGQCAGALATFVAVCVALWQTRYPFRKKLKLSFNSLVMATAIDGIATEYAVAVNVINTGKRPVTITEFSIMHKDDSRGIIFQERQGIFSFNMPTTIEADRNIDLHFLAESFVNHVAEMIEKKNIYENKKIKFRIKDTTGKEYFVKTSRNAKDYSRAYWR